MENRVSGAFIYAVPFMVIFLFMILMHDMYKAAKNLADGWQKSRDVSVSASTLRTMANELENIAKVYNLPKQH